MSDHTPAAQNQIDAYLAALREQLAGLPADDVEEILRELRGHIVERGAESDSGRNRSSVEEILRQLMLKPFLPSDIGLWVNSPDGFVLGIEAPRPHGPELLGWWIIPYGLAVGVAFILGTTVSLRWMLRFVPRALGRVAYHAVAHEAV